MRGGVGVGKKINAREKICTMVIVILSLIIIAMVDCENPNFALLSRITSHSCSHLLSVCSYYTLIPTINLSKMASQWSKVKNTVCCLE